MRRIVTLTLLWIGSGLLGEARDNNLAVRWADLPEHINGLKISTLLEDGSRIDARAISVEPEALLVTVSRSSNPIYGKGTARLPRTSLSTLRVQHTGWKWKVICPIVGFVGLGALGVVAGGHFDRGGFIVSNGEAVGALVGMAAGVTGGVLIGRWADRHYVTIQIIP